MMEVHFFVHQLGPFCPQSAILSRIGPIIWPNSALGRFCPSAGSRCRSHSNTVVVKFSTDGLAFAFFGAASPGEVHYIDCSLAFRWHMCTWVDPCFVDGHETAQKLLQISFKERQALFHLKHQPIVSLTYRMFNWQSNNTRSWYTIGDLLYDSKFILR